MNKPLVLNRLVHYLNDNGIIERLSPEEDEWSFELGVQRVFLRLGPGLLALTVDVHIWISTYRKNTN